MKNLLIFAGSNSSTSINKILASYAGSKIKDVESTILDLNDFEMPLYSSDREKKEGIPELAKKFVEHIKSADGIIISFAEHNGSYSAAFKNILDWVSRTEKKPWADKTLFLMATSPGGRGGSTVLEAASKSFPHFGAKVTGTFSLPSFYDNFSQEEGIKDNTLNQNFSTAIEGFIKALNHG